MLEGMRVTADVGTAKVLRRTDAVIGGKTGTAQVVKIRMVGERRQRTAEMAYLERDHAWIASYGRKDGRMWSLSSCWSTGAAAVRRPVR